MILDKYIAHNKCCTDINISTLTTLTLLLSIKVYTIYIVHIMIMCMIS